MTEQRKLVSKLASVMEQVKYIQKTGHNKFHNYKYATEADVNEKVREELAKHQIVMIPSVKDHSFRTHTTAKENTEYIVTVEVEFTFMDGETGETITFTTFGEGQDAGDKGTYKAITGAQKYALMKAFMIPTGDDPEADDGVDQRNNDNKQRQEEKPKVSSKQIGLIKAKVKELVELGGEEKGIYDALRVKLKCQFEDIKELDVEQASTAIETLMGWVKKKKADAG